MHAHSIRQPRAHRSQSNLTWHCCRAFDTPGDLRCIIAGMNASTMPPGSDLVEAWMAGEYTQDQLLEEIDHLEPAHPDVLWEVLALIDQNFRLRRISPEVFVSVRKRLERHSLGTGEESVPAAEAVMEEVPPPASASAAPVPPPLAAALRPGDLLRARYRILEILRKEPGETLFEAADEIRSAVPGVRQRVAIHVLDEFPSADPAVLQRMCRLQSLSHPGILRVLDVDSEGGRLFLTRELVGGSSLQQLLERNGGAQLAPPIARSILQSVANSLSYAHSQEICHGDVSARNVFITDLGETRLKDFEPAFKGIAAAPQDDRLAFAQLAYWLLSGVHAPLAGNPDPEGKRLRAPPGITRAQWHSLRYTLIGRQSDAREDVLSAFNSGSEVAPAGLLLKFPPASTPPRRSTPWFAAACVLAAMGAAAWSIATRETASVPPLEEEPAATSAAVVPARVADPVVPREAAPPPSAAEPVSEVPVTDSVAPRPRLDLPTRVALVDGDLPVARIWVRRQGSLTGDVSFLWWTESGTAEVDKDFREITPRTAVVKAGARGVELLVPVMPNASRDGERTFYVRIDNADRGASIGSRNLMQVAIVPR